MQMPHCTASCSMNAACSACNPSGASSPSTVSTVCPAASTASTVHANTGRPPISTVQLPHSARLQPTFVPVRRRSSRSSSARVWREATVSARRLPLTTSAIAFDLAAACTGGVTVMSRSHWPQARDAELANRGFMHVSTAVAAYTRATFSMSSILTASPPMPSPSLSLSPR